MTVEKKIHFLLVIHDADERLQIINLVQERFQQTGCFVEAVSSAAEALDKLETFPCDVCFLDAHLPGKESLSFLQDLAGRAITFPVIFLSDPGNENLASEALRLGAKQHLIKSALSPELLSATVRYVLVLEHNEKRRHKAESEAAHAQKRNQHLLRSISSILIGVREDGVVTHWNTIAEKTFGISSDYAVGRALSDCPIGWNFDFIQRAISVCLSDNSPVSLDDLPFSRGPGEHGLLGFSINPLEGEGGGCGEVLLLGADITEKRKATEELKAYTRQLEHANAQIKKEKAKDEAILAGIGEGLVVTDEQGCITLVNRQAILMFRWPGRQVIGQKLVHEVGIQDDRGQKISNEMYPVEQALRTGRKAVATGTHLFEDKTELPLQITASPVVLDGKITGVISIFRDLTREKEVDRTKTEFISTVSHELRTPLTSIREGVAQVFEGILGDVNQDQKEFLGIALEEVDRLAAIINDLLDISKIEAGKVVLKKSWVDLKELVEHVVFSYQSLVKNKRLELKAVMPDQMVEVFCDSDKVKQVLTNLLTNAYKFTEEGGRITIHVEADEHSVRVTVEDNGIGISAESLPKLFDKFVQVGRTAGPGIKGTGLGLTICKSLVEMHQGKIWVESRIREGSRFIFTLPKLEKDKAARENIEQELEGSEQLSILLMKLYRPKNASLKPGSLKPQQILKKFLQKARLRHLEDHQDIFLNGSDETLVILPKVAKDKALEFADTLKSALLEMIRESSEGKQEPFLVHIGVSTYPEDAVSSETLITKARVSVKPASSGEERRVCMRIYYRLPLKLKAGKGQAWEAQSADLSESGVRIFGSCRIAVGTVTDVILKLPHDYGSITPKAMVVWVREHEKDKRYELGLQFVGISEKLKNKLRRFIESEAGQSSGEEDDGHQERRKIA